MAIKSPEVASEMGMVDDTALADGEPVSAHILREMCRNANRLIAKSGVLFRWVVRADGSVGDGYGGGITFPLAGWSHAIPIHPTGVQVPKRLGVTKMRVAVRAQIDADATVYMQIGTSARPFDENLALASQFVLLGTGSMAQYTIADIPLRPGQGENLTFHVRAVLDADTDPLMDQGVYGGPTVPADNTGTVTGTAGYGTFVDSALTGGTLWNTTGATPSVGGHYVRFLATNNSMITVFHGPSRITGEIHGGLAGKGLMFSPPDTSNASPISRLRGLTYEVRKLPSFRIGSIACYSQQETP